MTMPSITPPCLSPLPVPFQWTAAQLTDAVPMKLHEHYRFVAEPRLGAGQAEPSRRMRPDARLRGGAASLPARFRIG